MEYSIWELVLFPVFLEMFCLPFDIQRYTHLENLEDSFFLKQTKTTSQQKYMHICIYTYKYYTHIISFDGDNPLETSFFNVFTYSLNAFLNTHIRVVEP